MTLLTSEEISKLSTDRLLRLYRGTNSYYYDWSNEEQEDPEIELYKVLLKYELSLREHIPKGTKGIVRKIMAKYRMKKDQAIKFIMERKITDV